MSRWSWQERQVWSLESTRMLLLRGCRRIASTLVALSVNLLVQSPDGQGTCCPPDEQVAQCYAPILEEFTQLQGCCNWVIHFSLYPNLVWRRVMPKAGPTWQPRYVQDALNGTKWILTCGKFNGSAERGHAAWVSYVMWDDLTASYKSHKLWWIILLQVHFLEVRMSEQMTMLTWVPKSRTGQSMVEGNQNLVRRTSQSSDLGSGGCP